MRSAQETDEERRARIYPIILSEYNPAWPEWYAEEKANLERLIGLENIVRISHYGSTSVPGLTAKPTIDILLEIDETADIDRLIAALLLPEYICLDEAALTMQTAPPHLMFIKGYLPDGFAEKVYHIHVVYTGDHIESGGAGFTSTINTGLLPGVSHSGDDALRFRDYLIAHPETAAEYAELKRKLFRDYEHNRDGYTEAKTDFIKRVTERARFYG
ncbi:MAG: GrpB family protein [Oscillospiraceae bacterium]|nr:GrpB family protein [Oscillospiraceae bacterium]